MAMVDEEELMWSANCKEFGFPLKKESNTLIYLCTKACQWVRKIFVTK